MKLREILDKAAKGEKLTEEETKFLAEYKEPEEGRIPKERLDREIAKRNEAEQKLKDAQEKLDAAEAAAKAKLEDAANKNLSEAEKQQKEFQARFDALTKQIKEVSDKHEQAAKELTEARFKASVADLARKAEFLDVDYLGFVAQQRKIDLAKQEAVDGLVADLKKTKPHLFGAKLQGGSGSAAGGTGTPPVRTDDHKKKFDEAKKAGNVLGMLEAAPPVVEKKE